jgi:hypothetical protein
MPLLCSGSQDGGNAMTDGDFGACRSTHGLLETIVQGKYIGAKRST